MPTALIGNKTCYYQDKGEGFPLLFGHSYLWSSDMWQPQIEKLSKNFRCIAVDLWDHGKSGHIDKKTQTLEDLSEDYYRLMQHLNLKEFSVIGLSVGGMWGAHLALNHKESVKSLIMMDTYLGSEPQSTEEKYNLMLNTIEAAQKFPEPLIEQIVPLFFSRNTLSQKKDLVESFKSSLRNYDKSKISGVVKLGKIIFSRKNLLNRFHEITMPTLIVVGADDIPRPVAEAKEMASLLPNSQLHIVDEAGHICNLEKPDFVTNLLHDFLKSHEEAYSSY